MKKSKKNMVWREKKMEQADEINVTFYDKFNLKNT